MRNQHLSQMLKEQLDREEHETQVGDTHLKSLLAMLAFDEEQHYAILKYLLENFVEKNEVISA